MVRLVFLLSLAATLALVAACAGGPQETPTAAAAVGGTSGTPATAGPSVTPVTRPSATSRPATATHPVLTASSVPRATSSPQPSSSPEVTATTTPTLAPDPAEVVLELEALVEGLANPSGIVAPPDGSGRLFLLEQPGRIRVVQNGGLLEAPFLDIAGQVTSQGNEQGLLGLAFHPDYAQNGRFLINYTGRSGDTVVSSWLVSQDPHRAEAGSETLVLGVAQPAANHNGGHLVFGPDGYLYVGLGDGGGAGDTYGNGQNGETLLGAMLRLDVDGAPPYTIPPGNPFLDDPAVRDEMWAIGLRNPWRYSFDRLTGDLYIADVGQNAYEEVNVQPAGSGGGENYGWPILEGTHCFSGEGCDREGKTMPVWEYDHSAGCSITGGYVYRGSRYRALQGIYLVADYCSGTIWGLARDAGGDWRSAVLAQTGANITSFGEDEAGELYLVDRESGTLYHLAARERP